ncbi:MAG: NifU N-terminal domain-containing protein, partial [Melioribacteraceae bacterium]|nr:NifU N-terminal domain-containing protein [Melioribacteraceae bacterium]
MKNISVNPKETTNPAILKFETSKFITNYESFEFNNIDEAQVSPLAQQLFYLPFVKKIYISGNFIAIERFNIVEWKDVQAEVSNQIEDYLNNGGSVIIKETNKKKIPVTIYAESTPNPDVLKFVSNKKLVENTYEFTSIEESNPSPLASELFRFPFVKSVFIDQNYVSVTKYNNAEWNDITMELREFIKGFIENGKLIISDNELGSVKKSDNELVREFDKLDDTSKEIINILNEFVKPAVA